MTLVADISETATPEAALGCFNPAPYLSLTLADLAGYGSPVPTGGTTTRWVMTRLTAAASGGIGSVLQELAHIAGCAVAGAMVVHTAEVRRASRVITSADIEGLILDYSIAPVAYGGSMTGTVDLFASTDGLEVQGVATVLQAGDIPWLPALLTGASTSFGPPGNAQAQIAALRGPWHAIALAHGLPRLQRALESLNISGSSQIVDQTKNNFRKNTMLAVARWCLSIIHAPTFALFGYLKALYEQPAVAEARTLVADFAPSMFVEQFKRVGDMVSRYDAFGMERYGRELFRSSSQKVQGAPTATITWPMGLWFQWKGAVQSNKRHSAPLVLPTAWLTTQLGVEIAPGAIDINSLPEDLEESAIEAEAGTEYDQVLYTQNVPLSLLRRTVSGSLGAVRQMLKQQLFVDYATMAPTPTVAFDVSQSDPLLHADVAAYPGEQRPPLILSLQTAQATAGGGAMRGLADLAGHSWIPARFEFAPESVAAKTVPSHKFHPRRLLRNTRAFSPEVRTHYRAAIGQLADLPIRQPILTPIDPYVGAHVKEARGATFPTPLAAGYCSVSGDAATGDITALSGLEAYFGTDKRAWSAFITLLGASSPSQLAESANYFASAGVLLSVANVPPSLWPTLWSAVANPSGWQSTFGKNAGAGQPAIVAPSITHVFGFAWREFVKVAVTSNSIVIPLIEDSQGRAQLVLVTYGRLPDPPSVFSDGSWRWVVSNPAPRCRIVQAVYTPAYADAALQSPEKYFYRRSKGVRLLKDVPLPGHQIRSYPILTDTAGPLAYVTAPQEGLLRKVIPNIVPTTRASELAVMQLTIFGSVTTRASMAAPPRVVNESLLIEQIYMAP